MNIKIPTRIAIEIILFCALIAYVFVAETLKEVDYINNRTAEEDSALLISGYDYGYGIHNYNAKCLSAKPIPVTGILYSDNSEKNLWNTIEQIFSCYLKNYSETEKNKKINAIKNALKKLSSAEIMNAGIRSGDISVVTIDNKINLTYDSGIISFLKSENIFSDEEIRTCTKNRNSLSYKRSGDLICYESSQLLGADPDSFIVFDYNIAKDKNNAYFSDFVISGIEPDMETFKFVFGGYSFAVDKDNVYFMRGNHGSLVKDIKPDQLSVLSLNVIKDKRHVFNYVIRSIKKVEIALLEVKGADAPSFIEVDPGLNLGTYSYFKDKNNVYINAYDMSNNFLLKIINGADPETFHRVLGVSGYDAEDHNHKYRNGVVVK